MAEPKFEYQLVVSDHQFEACKTIRRIVFVEEQGIDQQLDDDGHDLEAIHILVTLESKMVGTGRVYQDSEGKGHIARIAVLKAFRGLGIGKHIVLSLEREAQKTGWNQFYLHPHKHLEKFYERLGYQTVHGSEHEVDGHVLIKMEKTT